MTIESVADYCSLSGEEEVEFWAARASFQGKLAVKQADEKDAARASEYSRDSRGRGRGGRGGQRGKLVLPWSLPNPY